MTDKILWINRITAIIFFFIGVYICEKFKITPAWCFTFAIFWLIFMNFVFAIIEELIK